LDKVLYTGRGDTVQLGRELGKGGEGSVYEVHSHPKQVAKIYHQMPDKKKQE
jgi:DNA-binding helix-hairpin-helix protein with protein kinase domain